MSNDVNQAIKPLPKNVVASVNTHDTPTFAAFWEGQDIEDRVRLGHTHPNEAHGEREERKNMRPAVVEYLRRRHMMGTPDSTADVLGGALNLMASSEAQLLLVNVEDLWREKVPQNVPGTLDEHPNWRNRCDHSVEELDEAPGLIGTLKEIDRRRGS